MFYVNVLCLSIEGARGGARRGGLSLSRSFDSYTITSWSYHARRHESVGVASSREVHAAGPVRWDRTTDILEPRWRGEASRTPWRGRRAGVLPRPWSIQRPASFDSIALIDHTLCSAAPDNILDGTHRHN